MVLRNHHHLLRCIVVAGVAAGSTGSGLVAGMTEVGQRVVGSFRTGLLLEDQLDLDHSFRNFVAGHNFDHPLFRLDRLDSMLARS